jgi:UDP-GlcNAc:undecaprenyl-phosphate GlcNAc-1-phosphate transferase
LGYAAVPFTIFAVVGLTNAFNMLDGIDGLASGHGIITIVSLLVAGLLTTQPFQVSWILGLLAAIAAFWLINMQVVTWLPRVFLGDAGSTVLGFVFAWLLIGYSQKPWGVMEPVMALWCISIPAIDTVSVIIRRLKQKRSPFSPDRTHLHHLLLDAGVSARKTLWLLLGLTLAANLIGLVATKILGVEAGFILFVLFLVLVTYVMVSSKRLPHILGMMSIK